MFSHRTNWDLEENRLTRLLREKRSRGISLADLTASNPTQCGFPTADKVLQGLVTPNSRRYTPDARGSLAAREALAGWYAERRIEISPEQIFLTSGTSEAYSHLFHLLCNPGDSILSSRPSYPLFEHLTRLADVSLVPYDLHYDGEWYFDPAEIDESAPSDVRAIILLHPHNPTGMLVKKGPWERLEAILEKRESSLIADEVFSAYRFDGHDGTVNSFAGAESVLTFTLNGLSKLAGLPQLKLGWMIVSGPLSLRNEAQKRLEIISDAFLSVSVPVQNALPGILATIGSLNDPIRERVTRNLRALRTAIDSYQPSAPVSLLCPEGGWNAVLRLPDSFSDEEWCLQFLERGDVVTHPGYYFDFARGAYVVVSLLPQETEFAGGVSTLLSIVAEHAGPPLRDFVKA